MNHRLQLGLNQKSNIRTQGGYCRRKLRLLDSRRFLGGLPGHVIRIEYDPYRNARIMFLVYINGLCSYVLAPESITEGQVVFCSNPKSLNFGSAMLLLYAPVGAFVYNIEWRPGMGSSFLRAAGAVGKVIQKVDTRVIIQKRDGKRFYLSLFCKCCIGICSNIFVAVLRFKNAGQLRRLGVRPVVRGVARNPVDHPNGGRTPGGKIFKSVWGFLQKGMPTSSKIKRRPNLFITKLKN